VLAAACVAGCGGADEKGPSASSSTPAASPTTALPSASGPGDIATTTTTSALPVPADGPADLARFPVPKGVKVKGPGPQAQSWQFDNITKDTGAVLAFYRTALAKAGYQLQNDVDVTVGVEKVHYDIQFKGPAQGYIVADPSQDDVFVLVESLPAN
jgi:hypothetical protein